MEQMPVSGSQPHALETISPWLIHPADIISFIRRAAISRRPLHGERLAPTAHFHSPYVHERVLVGRLGPYACNHFSRCSHPGSQSTSRGRHSRTGLLRYSDGRVDDFRIAGCKPEP